MISNLKKRSSKDDALFILSIVLIVFFLIWLFFLPPKNKFLQICHWGNMLKFQTLKFVNKGHANDYILHRNNAVYLTKLYPGTDKGVKEMDLAIESLPKYAPETELQKLYKERAIINLTIGDQVGALNDYTKSGENDYMDNLRIALLYKNINNIKAATKHCNQIVNSDVTLFEGYACFSEVYKSIDRLDACLTVWNLAIDKKATLSKSYVQRAKIKKALGDMVGYNSDINKAKELFSGVDIDYDIEKNALEPKKVDLSIR